MKLCKNLYYYLRLECYARRRAIIAEATKSNTRTIVAVNRNFSKPRLVLQLETVSLPPNAPPAPASECCNRIKTVSKTASTICIIESVERISIVGDSIADMQIESIYLIGTV